jgi:hypothetical protein
MGESQYMHFTLHGYDYMEVLMVSNKEQENAQHHTNRR